MPQAFSTPELHSPVCRSLTSSANASFISRSCGGGLLGLGDFARPRKGGLLWDARETKEVCVLKGLFKFVLAIAVAAIVAVGALMHALCCRRIRPLRAWDKYRSQNPRVASCDAIVVLGASVLPDGSLSPTLQKRVDAAIDLYLEGRGSHCRYVWRWPRIELRRTKRDEGLCHCAGCS